MKIAVSGCRYFGTSAGSWHGDYIRQALEQVWTVDDDMLVGDAHGVDEMAKFWASLNDVPVKVYEADWDTHGRSAGPIRNSEMIRDADMLIAFWDNVSRGTRDAIRKARRKGIPVIVFSNWVGTQPSDHATPVRDESEADA